MKLLLGSTSIALWRDIIHDAESICDATLQEELETYLVFLMVRYTNKPEMVKQILAVDFLQGMNLNPTQRELALQEVGDKCLIFSGLFPSITVKKQVKMSYFVNMGQGAYATISKSNDDLYRLLAKQFVTLMDVLQCIRRHSKNYPDLLPLQAYELWNETGSKRALRVLQQFTTATPLRILKDDS